MRALLVASCLLLPCACGSGDNARFVPDRADEKAVADVTPEVNLCPTFRGYLVLPGEIPPAVDAAVFVQAIDPDGNADSLVYAWSADSGTFSRPEQPYTTYRCGDSGPRTLHLSARDPSGCFGHFDVEVRCLE